MNNFKIVGKYVDSKVGEGVRLYGSQGRSYALGALESKAGSILWHLEIYHPDAYNSVVGMFDVQEGDN